MIIQSDRARLRFIPAVSRFLFDAGGNKISDIWSVRIPRCRVRDKLSGGGPYEITAYWRRAASNSIQLYVDVIAHCYKVASGQPALLIETGESFYLLAAHRLREAVPI
jgi:hypothetical protein